jgi:ankyrin repeat protein
VRYDQRDAAALLLRRGADPNLAAVNGYSPLVQLVIHDLGMEDDDRVEFLKLLLDNGSDPNTPVSFEVVSGSIARRGWHGRHLWDGRRK